jgi:hypothetical protein
MSIQVLIEPVGNNGFRATTGEPLAVTVEAPTRDEALARLKNQLVARLTNGTELVAVEVDSEPHPWMKFAGMFKNDPQISDWKESMAEYRRAKDSDPDLL